MPTVVILYEPVIEFMKSWEGDIGRSVMGLCRRIQNFQKLYAPKKTGALMRSITIGPRGHGVAGIETRVGANPDQSGVVGVAWWQEKGTRPHLIRPKAGNRHGYLIFYWAKAGRVVYRHQVHHPGHRGTHWAERGMISGMAAWG